MARFSFSFRSDQAREITAHLTPPERNAIVANARDYGRRVGWRSGWVALACGLVSFYSFWLAAAVFVIAMLLLLPLMRSHCERVRVLLSNTAWARAHGIRPDTL